jgi:hypothetical protein
LDTPGSVERRLGCARLDGLEASRRSGCVSPQAQPASQASCSGPLRCGTVSRVCPRQRDSLPWTQADFHAWMYASSRRWVRPRRHRPRTRPSHSAAWTMSGWRSWGSPAGAASGIMHRKNPAEPGQARPGLQDSNITPNHSECRANRSGYWLILRGGNRGPQGEAAESVECPDVSPYLGVFRSDAGSFRG